VELNKNKETTGDTLTQYFYPVIVNKETNKNTENFKFKKKKIKNSNFLLLILCITKKENYKNNSKNKYMLERMK